MKIVLLAIYIILTGIWGFFAKVSGNTLDWKTNMAYIWIPAFIVNYIFVFRNAKIGFTSNHIFSIIGGIVAAIGTIIFYKLLSMYPASKIIPLSGLYVVVTAILCFLFAGEAITIKTILGIVFAVVSIVLLA